MDRPIVGITADLTTNTAGRPVASCAAAYVEAVIRARGIPIVLVPTDDHLVLAEHVRTCRAFVLTGGDDPRTEPFGVATHPNAKPVHPVRQSYETRLLECLQSEKDVPVLGICLGMQMMSLVAGGKLNQHLPDTLPTHGDHWNSTHRVRPEGTHASLVEGVVASNHRQAVTDPGGLTIAARSPDGVVEAVTDPQRRFYLGVQWHPERTEHAGLGPELFQRLVRIATKAG
ncbi:MAG: gamma-glutamyl-gamma-aminobutyrate hydrolase family protein [Phycisphaerae bacterium]|nr:gamma-glutamyl-gamma-aminobutyrate hydrolase family protein [Phycisphaerae bacterium]